MLFPSLFQVFRWDTLFSFVDHCISSFLFSSYALSWTRLMYAGTDMSVEKDFPSILIVFEGLMP